MVELGGAITCVVAGLGMLVLSRGMANAERHRRQSGVVVPGVVVGSEAVFTRGGNDSGGAPIEVAVVEFHDERGEVRRFRRDSGTTARPVPGTAVRVRYDPQRPEADPSVEDDAVSTGMRWVFGIAGAAALVVGVVLLGGALDLW